MANTQIEQPQFNIYQYIQLIIRRKWLIIFTAIPVLILGALYCLFTPQIFKATALIVAVPQKVPEAYIRSTVTEENDERIRGILREITSRTALEKIIKKFDLYPEMRKKYPMETVVERLKKEIKIENTERNRRNGLISFNLSYEGRNPELIAEVTNALANMFVEQNLQLRQTQAENTARFLDSELQKIYAKLKKTEEALKEYKLAHMGELPEQRDSNIATLTALQQQLQSVQENIRRAEDRRMLISQQLSDERIASRSLAANTPPVAQQGTTPAGRGGTELSLSEMQERLRILRSRYTEEHPDIVALKKAIESRKKAMAAQDKEEHSVNSLAHMPLSGNPAVDALKLQLRSAELEARQLKEEASLLKQKIASYQQRIENTPKREQELIDLTRDYDNLKQTYDSLLQRKLEAEQAAALERRQQGEQFRIIDQAAPPEIPIKPNLKKILPVIFVLAFGGGFGIAFVLDFLSTKFFDPDDVVKAFSLPVIACIPVLLTDKEKKQIRRREMCNTIIAVSGYAVSGFLFVILFLKGPGAFAGIL